MLMCSATPQAPLFLAMMVFARSSSGSERISVLALGLPL
jgi:hypothetical protein